MWPGDLEVSLDLIASYSFNSEHVQKPTKRRVGGSGGDMLTLVLVSRWLNVITV